MKSTQSLLKIRKKAKRLYTEIQAYFTLFDNHLLKSSPSGLKSSSVALRLRLWRAAALLLSRRDLPAHTEMPAHFQDSEFGATREDYSPSLRTFPMQKYGNRYCADLVEDVLPPTEIRGIICARPVGGTACAVSRNENGGQHGANGALDSKEQHSKCMVKSWTALGIQL